MFKRTRHGFTLVELMIVVAIIGILAAIAIPNFVAMQYRSKRAECCPNIQGIKTSILAYDAQFDTLVTQDAFWSSDLALGSTDKAPRPWTAGSGFDTIGWSPDGDARGVYKVESSGDGDFTITCEINVDGDSEAAVFTASKSSGCTMVTANDVY